MVMTMDYEQKYKEALGWMKSLYRGLHGKTKEEAEKYSPELAESEDERIRKELIFYLGDMPEDTELRNGVTNRDVLVWLEKQGKNNMSISEATKKKLEDNLNKALEEETPESWNKFLDEQGEQKEYTFKSLPRLLDMIEPTDRAKAYCQKLIDTLIKEGYATDAKIVGECLKKMNGENVPLAIMDEKQGEQKPADKVEPKFKIGDKIQYSKGCGTIMAIEKIENGEYVFANNMGHTAIELGNKWHLVEQKPADLPNGEDYGIDGLYAAVDILQKTLGKVEGYQTDDGILEHECAISAIKKLYEQKPAWSEEDEQITLSIEQVMNCASLLNIVPEKTDKIRTWLKSLKQRIGG